MGRFDGVLLCSDFDGTLRGKNDVTEENAEAIRYFKENGGLFTLATGRFPLNFNKYRDRIEPNTLLLCVNGTLIYDFQEMKPVKETFMNSDFGKYFERIGNKTEGIKKTVISLDDITSEEFAAGNFGEALGLISRRRFFKIIFYAEKGLEDEVLGKISSVCQGNYEISRSCYQCIEIQTKGINKGSAALWLKKFTRSDKLICVGDHENDIPMITAADVGYAVANAAPSLKAAAANITVSADEGAIAKIISEM